MPLFTINTAGTSPASKIYIYEILNKNSLQRSDQPGLVIEFVHDLFIASSVDITFVYHDVAWVPANMFDLSAGDSKNMGLLVKRGEARCVLVKRGEREAWPITIAPLSDCLLVAHALA